MIHRTIYIRGRWRVDVFIDNGNLDIDEVMDRLVDMGASYQAMEQCYKMMERGVMNEAFTYSNGRNTCIYIGATTSGEEFLNSVVHELRHLIDHIADYYGLGNGEAVGYLSGDMAFALADDICTLGCSHCRETFLLTKNTK